MQQSKVRFVIFWDYSSFAKKVRSITVSVKQCRPRIVVVRCGSHLFRGLLDQPFGFQE